MTRLILSVALLACVATSAAFAHDAGVVNVYTSRHYDADGEVYEAFTAETGIRVNLIEGDSDQLLARLTREDDLSPADVFITVDAGRLHKAVEAGVLGPTRSDVLEERVPSSLRHPDGLWFALSRRVRVIVVAPDVPADAVRTYADLAGAHPAVAGEVLVRSSSNIYNQSLVASLIANEGVEAAEAWCRGVAGNLARRPTGGDRDQIRGVAAGEGNVAVTNHYYFARMLAGDDASDREAASKLRLIFPDQDGRGTHVNISGAGVVRTAPNRDNAVRLIEFLTTHAAQAVWAGRNFEFPVTDGVELPQVLADMGDFKADTLDVAALGEHNREAVRVMDRAGWR